MAELEQLLAGIDDDGRRRIYSLLCWMALCDGVLHEREQVVLERWAKALDIEELARRNLEDQVRHSAPLNLGANEAELEVLVKALVEIVAADHWLDPEEARRLNTLAELLGLSKRDIQQQLLREAPDLQFGEG